MLSSKYRKEAKSRPKKKSSSLNVLSYMDSLVKDKYASGREGTANLYQATRNHVAKFDEKSSLTFAQFDTGMIHLFENYLRTCHLSSNSMTNYISVFRTVYNMAVLEDLADPAVNPFQKLKLHPVSVHKRSAEMKSILELGQLHFKSSDQHLDFARDLFLFSFAACGMAFVDLAYLTSANIQGNMLVYQRRKTSVEIRIKIIPSLAFLIKKYAGQHSVYLFPILPEGEVSYNRYKVALRTYNRRLKTIGARLPEPINLTSYVARHSWAMQAKNLEASIATIGEALGHTSEKTTRFYLSNLDQSILDKVNKKITATLEALIINSNSLIDPYLWNKGHTYQLAINCARISNKISSNQVRNETRIR